MTARKEGRDATGSAPRQPGLEAGFDSTRAELEEMATSELDGVVTDPKLLSNAGLWVTFQAREPCCGARVLVNVRSREGLDDGTLEAVFRAAARSRDLRHPAVLSTRRFGRTDDVVWVSTRAYRGRMLRVVTGAEPEAGRSRAIDLMRRVARPLEAAHRDGLVHGALGEASFHCDTGGRVRIRNLGLDVPLVRLLAPSDLDSLTVSCAAPEVLDGDVPVPESDQYALAALLVKIFTGSAPEPNGSAEWHAVPGPMRRPLRRALRLDPQERFSSVMDLWEALDPEQTGRRRDPKRRGVDELKPDEEMPGSPLRHAGEGESLEAHDGVGGHPRPATRERGAVAGADRIPFHENAEASDPTPSRHPGAPSRHPDAPPRRPGTLGSWGRRRRRRGRAGSTSGKSGGAGPWARSFAAAAALVLLFGTVELAGEWERLSPFASTPPDTMGPTASAEGLAYPMEDDVAAIGAENAAMASDSVALGLDEAALGPDSSAPGADNAEATDATGDTATGPRAVAPTDTMPERTASSGQRRTAMSLSVPEERGNVEAAEPGVLSLQSYPWGEVYLDGDFVGNSPILDLRVSVGPHEIRVERDGYEPYVEMVTVEAGEVIRRTGIVLRSRTR